MAKLYPPYIEGKLPAQCGETLIIPFELNRATGWEQIKNCYLQAKIKSVSTDLEISNYWATGNNITENSAIFIIDEKLKIGEYYKLQLGWSHDDVTAPQFYSTVGVFKFTAIPQINIEETVNGFILDIIYKSTDDSEPLYSYSYIVHDEHNREVLKKTDVLVTSKDIKINLGEALFKNTANTLLTFKSINNLITTYNYNSQIQLTTNTDSTRIKTTQVLDPGFNAIIFYQEAALLRKRQYNNATKNWEVINLDIVPNTLYTDKNIEYGEKYLYQIIYKDGTYEEWIPNPIYFEHIYISDAHHVYCLQFNPKVSSFKSVVMESKQNTMGSKYPTFFKNSIINYKEFPFSALISLLMNPKDEYGVALFSSDWWRLVDIDAVLLYARSEDEDYDYACAQDLTEDNIYNERQFRLEFLDWLNNGQPKFFRSPTEGNYITRITNISMTPNDSLGRMLYSVNCTVTEIAEVSQENLIKYKLI